MKYLPKPLFLRITMKKFWFKESTVVSKSISVKHPLSFARSNTSVKFEIRCRLSSIIVPLT